MGRYSSYEDLTLFGTIDEVLDTPEIRLTIAIIDLTCRDYVNSFGKWTVQRDSVFPEMQKSRHVFFPQDLDEWGILLGFCQTLRLDLSVFKKRLHDNLLRRLNRLPSVTLTELGLDKEDPSSI